MDLRLAHLEWILKKEGLKPAVKYLNSRVPYRFTTVYRLEHDVFNVIETVDKLDEFNPNASSSTPYSQSLCRFPVLHGTFSTSDTTTDPRLKGLCYPSAVGSYSGVQLTLANGDLYGTFCHYDFAKQIISHFEYQFLQLATTLITRHLQENASTYRVVPFGPQTCT